MTRHGGGSVFLLTDYGHADEFAGVVRAVVVRDAPGAPLVDLTHDVPSFGVRAGALALRRAAPHLGPGVVLAVVDPGVGTARRAVAVSVESSGRRDGPGWFVGPDNGLLPWALDELGGADAAAVLRPSRRGATTFDGRDVFAPAAACLWRGGAIEEVGDPIDPASLVRLPDPVISVRPGVVRCEVLWIDHFGNVQLAAGPDDATAAGLGLDVATAAGPDPALEVVTAGASWAVRRVGTFAELTGHELGLVADANGRLALVCDRRPAATVLGVGEGDEVTLRAAPAGRAPGR